MKLNVSLKEFKKKHNQNKNQIILKDPLFLKNIILPQSFEFDFLLVMVL